MAVLSPVGPIGRHGPTGEHDSMRAQQLLDSRVLEIMA